MDENPPENLKYLISKLQISDFFTDDVYVSLEALPLPSYGSYEIIKKDKITLRDNNQTWQKMLKNKKKSTVTFAINFMMI